MSFGVFSPFELFGIIWGEVLILVWMFGKIHLWNPLVQDSCLLGVFWLLIWLVVVSLSRISFSPWFSLGRLYVSRNLCVSSRLSSLLACDCSWCFLTALCILWCQFSLLFFHFWFYLFGSFLFFSWWVWLKIYQFCLSLQRMSSWFQWSFILFFF